MATATLEISQPLAEELNQARGSEPIEAVADTSPPQGDLWPAQIPGEILLGSVADARLRVTSPLHVRLVRDENHIVAEAVGLDEFGVGADVVAARLDLQRAIVELFLTLEREQA